MMQCRMCSQRLTRPGKLCRECERELQRAQYAGLAIGDLAPVVTASETSRMAGGIARLRAPGPVVAVAFAIGVAATVTLHVVDNSEAAATHGSVMLDPHARGVRQVSIVSAGAASAQGASQAVPVAASATVNVSSPAATANASPTPAPVRVRAPASTQVAAVQAPVEAPANGEVPVHAKVAASDPKEALGEALARCGDEPFLARPACEERARGRYCDGAAWQPQCARPTRDYGQ